MGSNGNHRLDQLSHVYLHILQLQWTPIGSNGKLVYAVWEGGRSALGEAVAHAPPGRRGARSTPRGYAPLESSGNGWLRQPMHTFFYCENLPGRTSYTC